MMDEDMIWGKRKWLTDDELKDYGVGLPNMWDRINRDLIKVEEDCIIQVLTQLLKRKPDEEDFKKSFMLFENGEFSWYWLAYGDANNVLGKVTRNFPPMRYNGEPNKYQVIFEPHGMYKNKF